MLAEGDCEGDGTDVGALVGTLVGSGEGEGSTDGVGDGIALSEGSGVKVNDVAGDTEIVGGDVSVGTEVIPLLQETVRNIT